MKTFFNSCVAGLTILAASLLAVPTQNSDSVTWTFDRLEKIGGHKTTVIGQPKVINSPIGKAVEFDGVDDGLFIDEHPLAGATTFTWEAIFRPDGGQREQRWFHLNERDAQTDADTQNRMLFEIRVSGDQWYLDSYIHSGDENQTLMNNQALHPLGVWYHVATVYDGKVLRNYVNGVQQGAGPLKFIPHRQGHASTGVRINKVFYFKGAVQLARFTRRALSPSDFLPPPASTGLIPQLMKDGDVPGLSIALLRDGQVFWNKSFGVRNAETKEPLAENAVFEAASLAKPVFAYAVLKLVDNGKLDLDTPLINYFPAAFPQNDERARLITARMVLSHRTGFQNELMPGQSLEIHFTPGEKFSYSGEGFLYLQKVVDHITGERFDTFMKRTVFDPLGMTSSGYLWEPRYDRLAAFGHNAAGFVAERTKFSDAKMSGLLTTTGDYAKFVIAIMNGAGLQTRTAQEMLKTQTRVDESCVFCINRGAGRLSPALSWGLGWGLEDTGAGHAFWHWGENRGEFQNFVMAYQKEKIGIVIFTNSGNGFSIIPEIVSQAIGGTHPAFAWMGYELYNSPKFVARRAELRAARTLYDAIVSRGEAALKEYRERREVLSEQQLNQVGYWLLSKKRVKEAIEVFKMNVEDHPNSSNAYDSLGEAYMVAGNKPEAIRNYQRSLSLNPANDNARETIKKLERP